MRFISFVMWNENETDLILVPFLKGIEKFKKAAQELEGKILSGQASVI